MKYKKSIANFRKDYQKMALVESLTKNNPFSQFFVWFNEAIESPILEANAMIVATVNKNLQPSSRVVLLKGFGEEGFVFFTNYNSKKGKELIDNPKVSLLFFWDILERQVRIEGNVEKLSFEDSEKYFHSRPKGSQIGAWASAQSEIIKDRNVLEDKKQALEKQYENAEKLPCPEHWGGFLVKPNYFEFWQGRSNRLHDRIFYELNNNDWKKGRLAP